MKTEIDIDYAMYPVHLTEEQSARMGASVKDKGYAVMVVLEPTTGGPRSVSVPGTLTGWVEKAVACIQEQVVFHVVFLIPCPGKPSHQIIVTFSGSAGSLTRNVGDTMTRLAKAGYTLPPVRCAAKAILFDLQAA